MNIFDSVARLEREHDANLTRVEAIRNEIHVAQAERDASEDYDAADALDGQIPTLERRLKLADGVAKGSAGRLEAARVEAQNKAADAEHAAAEKHSKADEKLARAALTAIQRAEEAIQALVVSNEATAAANSARGDRPYIEDPETRVRRRPDRTEPAIFEDRSVWKDAAGSQPTIFVTDRVTGELRPQDLSFTRRTERVCVQTERVIPPSMPARLAELLPALREALRG